MAAITRDLIDRLLNEEEGASLDFKREQYPFVGAGEGEQVELVKDILAFANAWRRSDAFILIGVEEVKGGRHRVVGVEHHLEDASLQQLVNSKTQRPIDFSYVAINHQDNQIGIIHIPVQQRPFYLKKSFGGLQPNVVYLRRGSSTAIADPDEIFRMGHVDGGVGPAEPSLALQFTDPFTQTMVGTSVQLDLEILAVPSELRTRPIPPSSLFRPEVISTAIGGNPRYHEEAIEFLEETSLLKPLGLCLANLSGIPARDVNVEIMGPENEPILLVDASKYPRKPSRSLIDPGRFSTIAVPNQMIAVRRHGAQRRVVAEFGKILPKETVWSDSVFYVGAIKSCQLAFKAHIYAENLSSPLIIPMDVAIRTVTRPMTQTDLDHLNENMDAEESDGG